MIRSRAYEHKNFTSWTHVGTINLKVERLPWLTSLNVSGYRITLESSDGHLAAIQTDTRQYRNVLQSDVAKHICWRVKIVLYIWRVKSVLSPDTFITQVRKWIIS